MKNLSLALRGKCLHVRPAMLAVVAGVAVQTASMALAQEPVRVPMTADRWDIQGTGEFSTEDGFPSGVMKVTKGFAVVKGLEFRNGTIEFDTIPLGSMGTGMGFRRRDNDTYEDFYLRPKPNCATAVNCIQYAPQTHGVLLWDVFPQYQGPAPLKDGTWNHLKLVVSGKRMNVFVNGATTPTLEIGRLEGDVEEGGVLMQGPGSFANVTVTPDAVEGLAPEPLPDVTDGDKRFLREWEVSSSSLLPTGKEPLLTEMPGSGEPWQRFHAERGGLVNLSRQYGLPFGQKDRAVAWLKTEVNSSKVQSKHVSIGWSREIWVFVNGKLVYADKNLFQPPSARKSPDGRVSLENGSFELPLQKGKNEIAVALANNFYGWGLEMRLADLNDLRITQAKSAATAPK